MCNVGGAVRRATTPPGASAAKRAAAAQQQTVDRQAQQQDAILQEQRDAEAQRQGRIEQGRASIAEAFGGFDDNFIRGREGAYTGYYMPQLSQQFRDTRNALVYALSDAGTLNSSVAGDRLARLDGDYAARKLELADQARSYGQQVRADIEGARSRAVNNLLASGDVGSAQLDAQASARSFGVAPTFSPLAQVFQNLAAGVGAASQVNQAQALQQRVNSGLLFKPPASSGRVVAG